MAEADKQIDIDEDLKNAIIDLYSEPTIYED